MNDIIIELKERNLFYRIFYSKYIKSFLFSLFLLWVFIIKIKIELEYSIIYSFIFSVIGTLLYLEEQKYYTYKIELEGKYLKLKTQIWRKKKTIVIDLTNVTIYYSKYGIVRSVNYRILVFEGVNTPQYKSKKLIHIINPDISIFYRDWTQEKVKDLYDILIEIQKNVIEKEANNPKS